LRLGQIQTVFSLGAPGPPGASPVSVRHGTCTTDCQATWRPPGRHRRDISVALRRLGARVACRRARHHPGPGRRRCGAAGFV